MDSGLQFVLFACIAIVVFSVPTTSKSRFEPEISEECRKQGYCETVPNYPKDLVRKLIAELKEDFIKENFHTAKLDTQIAQRDGDGGTLVGLCNITETLIAPLSVQDPRGNWWLVLQDPEKNITQTFVARTCDTSADGCSAYSNISGDYQHKCRQNIYQLPVYALTVEQKLLHTPVSVPSYCSCVISHK